MKQIPHNSVLGYFELASVAIKRKGIFPFEYFEGARDRDNCGVFFRNQWPQSCCDSLTIDGATYVRPSWF